jgi:ABC-type polysaccharide/polyol phosphate export permease
VGAGGDRHRGRVQWRDVAVVFGLSTLGLIWAAGAHLLVAAAIGCVVATLGADVASALYERYLAKRAGLCDVRPRSSDGER